MANVTSRGRDTIGDFVEEIGQEIQGRWRSNLTNEEQESLVGDVKTFRDNEITQVGSKNEVLKFLEYGTSPHEITPKNADVLAFEWPDAPAEIQQMFASTFPLVFFKKVKHPGTKAYAHMRGAVEQVRSRG